MCICFCLSVRNNTKRLFVTILKVYPQNFLFTCRFANQRLNTNCPAPGRRHTTPRYVLQSFGTASYYASCTETSRGVRVASSSGRERERVWWWLRLKFVFKKQQEQIVPKHVLGGFLTSKTMSTKRWYAIPNLFHHNTLDLPLRLTAIVMINRQNKIDCKTVTLHITHPPAWCWAQL